MPGDDVVQVGRRLRHQVERESRTLPRHAGGDALAREDVQDARFHCRPHRLHARIQRVLVGAQIAHRFDRRGDGNGMAVVGACHKRPARGIGINDAVHILRLAAHQRQGEAVGHGLAIDQQVGDHAAERAVAAQRMAKAGLYLVEHQQEAELVRQIAQAFQIAGLRLHHADILQQGLGDQGGDGIAAADILHRLQVVVVHRMDKAGIGDGGARPQRPQRIFAGRYPRTDLGQRVEHVDGQLVVIAVIAALHHDDVLLPRDSARDADGQRGGFAAGVEQGAFLNCRHGVAHQPRQDAFGLRRPCAEQAFAAGQRPGSRFIDGREIVAQKIGRKSRMVINVALAGGVPQIGAFGLCKGDGRINGAIDRGDTAGNVAAIVVEGAFGGHGVHAVSSCFRLLAVSSITCSMQPGRKSEILIW